MRACYEVELALVAAVLFTAGCTHLTKGPPGPPNFAPDPGIDEAYANEFGGPWQRIPTLAAVPTCWVSACTASRPSRAQ